MDLLRSHIRWMIRPDMPAVLAIEVASFAQTWTADEFQWCLRQRNCIGMVAETPDGVAGFMIYQLYPDRLDVLNLAVRPDVRRGGVGAALLARLVTKCSTPPHRVAITATCRAGNDVAQGFFRACEFKARHFVRSFYADTGEDAVTFRLDLQRALTTTGAP